MWACVPAAPSPCWEGDGTSRGRPSRDDSAGVPQPVSASGVANGRFVAKAAIRQAARGCAPNGPSGPAPALLPALLARSPSGAAPVAPVPRTLGFVRSEGRCRVRSEPLGAPPLGGVFPRPGCRLESSPKPTRLGRAGLCGGHGDAPPERLERGPTHDVSFDRGGGRPTHAALPSGRERSRALREARHARVGLSRTCPRSRARAPAVLGKVAASDVWRAPQGCDPHDAISRRVRARGAEHSALGRAQARARTRLPALR